MRKAAPTLVQALYQDPRWIAQWTNFMYKHSVHGEEGAAGFDGFRIPADIRAAGYAFLPGQEGNKEPLYVRNDILPMSVLSNVNTSSVPNFANSVMSQLGLPYQVAIEQATGRDLFLNRPLPKNQSFADYLMNKLPAGREGQQILNPDVPLAERILTSRAGLGLPIKKLSEQQQLFAEQEWKDRMVDQPLKDINNSQDMFYIAPGTDAEKKARTYVVKNNMVKQPDGNSTPVATFYTAKEAIDFVKKNLPKGYKKVQKTYDIDNQGNPVYRPVGG
jgi:hypothetical protein